MVMDKPSRDRPDSVDGGAPWPTVGRRRVVSAATRRLVRQECTSPGRSGTPESDTLGVPLPIIIIIVCLSLPRFHFFTPVQLHLDHDLDPGRDEERCWRQLCTSS